MKKLRNMKFISILILVLILCLAVLFLRFALSPIDDTHIEGYSTMAPVNETNYRRTTSNSLNNRQSLIVPPRIADTRPTTLTSNTDTEVLEKEDSLDIAPLPFGLDDVIRRNSDGTNTITDDTELELGDGIALHLPKGTVIESDGIIRVGAQGAQFIDAAGNIVETFPPGHGIGFSYYDEGTSQESSFDMLGTIEEQQKEKKSNTGCNNIGTTTFQTLMLLLFLGIKQLKKERTNPHD